VTDVLLLGVLVLFLWWSWRSSRKTLKKIQTLENELEAKGFERTISSYGVGGHGAWQYTYKWRPPRQNRAQYAPTRGSRVAYVIVKIAAVLIVVMMVISFYLAALGQMQLPRWR
jgi:hypothetical protein